VSSYLDSLAARVATDPDFLAFALHLYKESERLDREGLAAALGCPAEALVPLALCRMPRPERFGADVAAIALRFGLDAVLLAALVRRAQGVSAMRAKSAGETGGLMAARDRQEKEKG
jgi:hypothetical protein